MFDHMGRNGGGGVSVSRNGGGGRGGVMVSRGGGGGGRQVFHGGGGWGRGGWGRWGGWDSWGWPGWGWNSAVFAYPSYFNTYAGYPYGYPGYGYPATLPGANAMSPQAREAYTRWQEALNAGAAQDVVQMLKRQFEALLYGVEL